MATTTPKAMRRASIRGRAWRLLRLAVLRARKGVVVHGLRLLKTLGRSGRSDRLRYASCANFGAAEQEDGEDAGVDVKAEEFIANFYLQMRMQRQISLLQYNEMMHRSIC
ncbi:unnamed protein product [Triticum turgidum subsp. durum]|uniref:Uncharacterized protein n=1 Tax=Triticum turgidum subsp. durum TaxID=4567 RepID=A0A9R0T4V7_TRITD|nr:unnamed protein product [Triticum turgidum subsp. durum]